MATPRYRTGDRALDDAIWELVDQADVRARDLVFELVVSALRLGREHTSRADLKIANSSLKDGQSWIAIRSQTTVTGRASRFRTARMNVAIVGHR